MRTGCCSTRNYLKVDHTMICTNAGCANYLGVTTLSSRSWKLVTATGVMAFCMLYSLNDFSKGHAQKVETMMPVKEVEVMEPLTLETLKQEILEQNIQYPEVVYAQIRIESGNLSSYLTKRVNNMLGMRFPCKRPTKAAGIFIPSKDTIIYGTQQELRKYAKLSNYAVYATWQDAVADYKLWQESTYNSNERYLGFLGNIYAEDTMYVHKIRKMVALKAN